MTQSVTQALAAGIARLRTAGVPDPARDARRLMAAVLGVAADRLTLHLQDPFEAAAAPRWGRYLEARIARQPVSQILETRAFYGRNFRVTPDVLDPRPETEELIALALRQPARHVLDIGTGSGCILLTLLAEWPDARGVATDLSSAALGVAAQNAADLGIAARAEFVQGEWAHGVAGPFDLIVSNPPYIAEHELADLSPEVIRWEPAMALSPGVEGLESYRALVPQAAALLSGGGRLLLEIGPAQAQDVVGICESSGFDSLAVFQDLDGRDRVVSAEKPL